MSGKPSYKDVSAAAKGLWPEILKELGVDGELLSTKPDGRPCPACKGTDRFNYNKTKGRFYCRQCKHDGFALLQAVHGGALEEARDQVAAYLGMLSDEHLEKIDLDEYKRRAAKDGGANPVPLANVEEERLRAKCTARAEALWEKAGKAKADHPYVVAKKITPYGAGQLGEKLVLTLANANGELTGLQFIHPDGSKKFLKDTAKTGNCFWIVGDKKKQRFLICEGYATGASLHEATGCTVVVAFDAGNLLPVAICVRTKLPHAELVLCADDDFHIAGNPGITKARAAALAVGGLLAVPDFGADRPAAATDFNDLHQHLGLDTVRDCVNAAAAPVEPKPNAGTGPEATAGVSLYDGSGKQKTQSTVLLELAGDVELFHDSDGEPYAVVEASGRRQVLAVRYKPFREVLQFRYYQAFTRGVSAQAMQDAIDTLAAKAKFEGEERPVHMRVAAIMNRIGTRPERIYLDLADDQWRVVEVTASGWQVLNHSPVMFTRKKDMRALPLPELGGCVEELRQFVNVTDAQWPLIYGFLLAVLRGIGPYPLLVLQGEQGTGKSTSSQALKEMVDPAGAALLAPTRDVDDLRVMATNCPVIALDNLSGLSAEMSDALCRLATGGGIAKRTLYTNSDMESCNLQRPVMVNGIDDIATRSDLMSRALQIEMPLLPDAKKASESGLWADFRQARPKILGTLLDMVVAAIRGFDAEATGAAGRMVDLRRWVAAAERGTGRPLQFQEAYRANGEEASAHAVESSSFALAVLRLVEKDRRWQGTATALLAKLNQGMDDKARKAPGWPGDGRATGRAIRRSAPNLRACGVSVVTKDSGSRLIHLDWVGKLLPATPLTPEPSSGADLSAGVNEVATPDSALSTPDSGVNAQFADNNAGLTPAPEASRSAAAGVMGVSGNKKPTQSNSDEAGGGKTPARPKMPEINFEDEEDGP